jgi:Family of unknown function (DUF6221)
VTDDIVGFTRQRLAEDEALASGNGIWHAEAVHTLACAGRMNDTGWEPRCRCEVPARVLRGVEAKRRIVDECERLLAEKDWEYDDAPQFAEFVERQLAAEWDNHLDYRQEWKP